MNSEKIMSRLNAAYGRAAEDMTIQVINYNLLRPFDLEAARRGEPVLQQGEVFEVRWVARSGDWKSNIVEGPDMHTGMKTVRYVSDELLRMAPLCWVEGRPVYPGDHLWHHGTQQMIQVTGIHDKEEREPCIAAIDKKCASFLGYYISSLTWTPPIVKREGWVNVYRATPGSPRAADVSNAYETKEIADVHVNRAAERIACVRIEWEEPVGQENGA